jgi:hypothetical protein
MANLESRLRRCEQLIEPDPSALPLPKRAAMLADLFAAAAADTPGVDLAGHIDALRAALDDEELVRLAAEILDTLPDDNDAPAWEPEPSRPWQQEPTL